MNGFKTESGAVYGFSADGSRIRRINSGYPKRADGEWVRLVSPPVIAVGKCAVLIMESLAALGPDDHSTGSPGPITTRITTSVTEVW